MVIYSCVIQIQITRIKFMETLPEKEKKYNLHKLYFKRKVSQILFLKKKNMILFITLLREEPNF